MDLAKYNTKTSPFLDIATPFTTREKLKMLLLGIFVIPRILLILICLLLFALLSTIATFNMPDNKPLPPMQRKLMEYTCPLALACVYLMGFSITIKGWENYEKAKKIGVRIMLFNHVSYVDAFALCGLVACSGLSKESNKNLPILGRCIRGLQNIYVPDNKQVHTKKKLDNNNNSIQQPGISKLIKDRILDRRYPMIAMAPEGTCGNGRCLLKFRTGAFVAGQPVLPVLLKYSNKHLNPAWVIMNEPLHFIRLLCQFVNKLEITFLDIYNPSLEEIEDPSLFAENVRETMAANLGVPTVEESYNHYYALNKLHVNTTWDSSAIIAPPGTIDEHGFVDLTSILGKKED